jgi:hypothetical protein
MFARRLRVAIFVCAGVAALTVTSTATAAFVPRLAVSHTNMSLQGTGTNVIRVTVPRDDDALFRAVIYAPPGYTYNLSQSAGIQVGTVTAQVLVREPIAGAVLPLTGTIVSDAPGNHVTNQCAPGLHSAVWILVLQASGQELRVPVYVDIASQAETSFASLKMTTCLPSPHIPASAGGAAFGAKLIQAQLNIESVRAPNRADMYQWRVVATPWLAPATPNVPQTAEARALIGFPSAASLALRVVQRRRSVTWSGRLTEGGEGIQGIRVQMLRGGARGALRARVQKTTNARGAYSGTIRFRGRGRVVTRIQIRAVVPERVSNVCSEPTVSPTPTPRGCVSETRAFFTVTSPIRRAVIRARR